MTESLKKYLTAIPLVILGLTPPRPYQPPVFESTYVWVWLVLISGFLGIVFALYSKAELSLKILALYLFGNCFISQAPYLSLTAYFGVIACLYYYLLCKQIRDWGFFYKIVKAILILNAILFLAQKVHVDKILNFNQTVTYNFGTIGNFMQLKSFIIVLFAFAVAYKKPPFIAKYWRYLLALAMVLATIYAVQNKVIEHFLYARGPVWLETIKLSTKEPFFGYGIGTYKYLFPPLSHYVCGREGLWMAAHNCFLQLLFEAGLIGICLLAAYAYRLIRQLFSAKNYYPIIGILMVMGTMLVHFPTRMSECVLILIMFFAYCKSQTEIQEA